MDLMREFEVIKRNIDMVSDKSINIKIPAVFSEVSRKFVRKSFAEAVADSPHSSELKVYGDKMKFSPAIARSLFQKVMDKIAPIIDKCISGVKDNAFIKDISLMLMVGGFSDSPYVQQFMKDR